MFFRSTAESPKIPAIDSTRRMMLAALFASLTAVGAFIRIPIPPVPFTLQTLFVFLSAGFLGASGGFMSQCLYLAVGLIGLPVFSGGGGIGYIFDPRFGYLLGFPVSAFVMGIMVKRLIVLPQRNKEFNRRFVFVRYIWVYAAGSVIIFAFGLTFLFFYAESFLGSFYSILWAGFLIFIPTNIAKIIFGSWLSVRLYRYNVIR